MSCLCGCIPQAHLKTHQTDRDTLTHIIGNAIITLTKAAANNSAAHSCLQDKSQSEDEPSRVAPKSARKKRGHSKADASPSVQGLNTPDVPTASQEQPHRHTQGSPGDAGGNTQTGTQGDTQTESPASRQRGKSAKKGHGSQGAPQAGTDTETETGSPASCERSAVDADTLEALLKCVFQVGGGLCPCACHLCLLCTYVVQS